jgi:hypothetical protein
MLEFVSTITIIMPILNEELKRELTNLIERTYRYVSMWWKIMLEILFHDIPRIIADLIWLDDSCPDEWG